MKSVFARHGIPDEVIADNMPFSSKECIQFAQEWGFEINTSSPRYPQSNGMSERTIQTVKNLLKKAEDDGNDPYIALLEYRCKTAISTLQFDKKKVTTPLNTNRWNVIVNQFSFILMEYKLCRGVNWFLRWNFTIENLYFRNKRL